MGRTGALVVLADIASRALLSHLHAVLLTQASHLVADGRSAVLTELRLEAARVCHLVAAWYGNRRVRDRWVGNRRVRNWWVRDWRVRHRWVRDGARDTDAVVRASASFTTDGAGWQGRLQQRDVNGHVLC